MRNVTMEVCCGSVEDVLQAYQAGADRVELNSCLFQGGLTPSLGELLVAKEMTNMPIITMVRPRQGAFCYTDAEFRTALADAKVLLENGADGLVFGFLKEDGTVDTARCQAILDIIGEKEAVFHRAIDVVPDWREALDELIRLGVKRVLTSGQAPDVFYGIKTVAEMIRHADAAIQIMPGAGVTLRNIDQIVEDTGCTQIHVARFQMVYDHSGDNHQDIFFGGALYPPEDRYEVIDGAYMRELRARL